MGAEGPEGPAGPAGSPWTVGGLPKGSTELGEWSVTQSASKANELIGGAISFNVPLAAPLSEAHVHFIGTEEELAGEPNESPAIKNGECKGSVEKPEAASGNLCVFGAVLVNVQKFNNAPFVGGLGEEGKAGADEAGAQLTFLVPNEGLMFAKGSWAVTG